jgi:hypothetical protein
MPNSTIIKFDLQLNFGGKMRYQGFATNLLVRRTIIAPQQTTQ